MSKVHVYTITYNEEIMLPQFINHYRNCFPNCNITVYDNESTDNTVEIANNNNCEVISWTSNNTIRDDLYLQIKNNCWKTSIADWVVVVDCDEFVNITADWLDLIPSNIIRTEGWDMIGDDGFDVTEITKGIRSPGYDKPCIFKRADFKEINYLPGCHHAQPETHHNLTIHFNNVPVKLWHYKWINLPYVIERYKEFNQRLSDVNKQYGWGIQYTFTEDKLRQDYETFRNDRIKVR